MKIHVLVNPRTPTGLMNRVDPFAVHGFKYIKHLSQHFEMVHYGIPGAQVDCEHVDIPTTPTEHGGDGRRALVGQQPLLGARQHCGIARDLPADCKMANGINPFTIFTPTRAL